tara:strand:+ start:315 stop:893 length:579 start_codon:yes stop_codon:yes gene_type:complete
LIKKNFLLLKIIIFFLLFLNKQAYAEFENELIKKIQNTNTLTFQFNQKINDKIQKGKCIIKYPKLMRCDYEDAYKKRLISNGKTLAIIQRRYKKIFYYPLKTTPLYFILDKEYLIKFIKTSRGQILNNLLIKYEIIENNNKLSIFFDKESLNLKGWKTVDMYKNDVDFSISNLKINLPIEKKLFKIPTQENL